jgi:hypothetical protein
VTRSDARGGETTPALARDEIPARSAEPGSTLFFASWGGSTLAQVGRDRPTEGNPEAPMSLAVDSAGRVLVLDQVNGRLVRRDREGKPESAIALALTGPQDLATGADGSAVVMDRLISKALAIYDPSGHSVGQLPLDPAVVGDPGLLTGVFVDGKDVWVEKEHGALIRVGDTSGQPADGKDEMPGRPSRDGGSLLSAGIIDGDSGRVFVASIVRATREHRFTRELRYAGMVQSLLMLDSDRKGTIYVASSLTRGEQETVVLSCLEPEHGQPIGGAELPPNTSPEETFRDLTVLDDGGVVYAHRTETGVSYETYRCK